MNLIRVEFKSQGKNNLAKVFKLMAGDILSEDQDFPNYEQLAGVIKRFSEEIKTRSDNYDVEMSSKIRRLLNSKKKHFTFRTQEIINLIFNDTKIRILPESDTDKEVAISPIGLAKVIYNMHLTDEVFKFIKINEDTFGPNRLYNIYLLLVGIDAAFDKFDERASLYSYDVFGNKENYDSYRELMGIIINVLKGTLLEKHIFPES
ncbi:MAG: hypothetical protein ACMG57_01445 [Candidatus Dojkabacteria bacterium]